MPDPSESHRPDPGVPPFSNGHIHFEIDIEGLRGCRRPLTRRSSADGFPARADHVGGVSRSAQETP